MNSTKLSTICDKVLEMGWTLAVIVTPLFFNVYSSRVFEPDKLTTLRTIAVVMAATWLVKTLEEWLSGRRTLDVNWRTPLVLPTLFTVFVYLTSTAFSVTPRVSFFGSYQRLQGTFTTLSYIVIFLIIVQGLRSREQLERLSSAIVLTSLPIAVYGLVQHNRADPLPWGGDVSERVASNMGNAIFVAAYLIMIVPLTITRIVNTFGSILTEERSGASDVLRAAVYIFILLAQLIAVYYSQSRGPMLGLLGGLGIWALLASLMLQRARDCGDSPAPPRLPGGWGRIVSLGAVGLTGAALLGVSIMPQTGRIASPIAGAIGTMLVLLAVLGGIAGQARAAGGRALRGFADLVSDLGRALGLLAVSGLAAASAAIILYFASGAILVSLDHAGSSVSLYAAAVLVLLVAAGAWLAGTERAVGWWMGSAGGLGLVLIAVVLVARGQPNPPQVVAAGGSLLAVLALWLLFIVNRWGWRWMWMSVMVVGLLGGGLFFAINRGGPLHDWARQQPAIRRYTTILSTTGGTARVRSLIWEGALEMVLPHDPITFPPTSDYPQGREDGLNSLRPLIGYGPEAMYVAYNSFYPPLLGHYESRIASPDRSHNETMDSVVITGFLGLAAYVWLFGSVLYFGVKWLGLLSSRWKHILLLSFLTAGVLGVLGVVLAAVGPNYAGLAVPVGLIVGLFVFLAVAGFSTYWRRGALRPPHGHSVLLIGILAVVVSHLIEINFGIAIAATRTTFWALAGVLVVAGTGLLPRPEPTPDDQNQPQPAAHGGEQNSRTRRRRGANRRRAGSDAARAPAPIWGWVGSVLVAGVLGGFMLGTLSFDFVTNAERLSDPQRIVARALTVLPAQGGRTSYGALLIFGVTWVMGGVLLVPDIRVGSQARTRRQDQGLAYTLYALISLAMGYFFALALATRQASFLYNPSSVDELIAQSHSVARILNTYYWFLLTTAVAGTAGLVVGRSLPFRGAHAWSWAAAIALAVASGVVIVRYNVRPIQADIVYKQAEPYDRQKQYYGSVHIYDLALSLAPWEDFYHLYLGRSLLEFASSFEEPAARDESMRQTEAVLMKARDINPLNTDHSANLARMYRRWGGLTEDPERRQELYAKSAQHYAMATTLSPNNAVLWNEWSLLNYWDRRDVKEYERVHARSLQVDPEYEQTWLICGDVNRDRGELDEAVACYERALNLEPDQAQVWRVLADTYIAQQDWNQAISALARVVELQPPETTPDIWSVHNVLSQLHQQTGNREQALREARVAVQLAPQDQITVAQGWLAQLLRMEAAPE